MRTVLPCLLALWAGLAAAQTTPLPEADVRAVVDHVASAVIAPTYGAFARVFGEDIFGSVRAHTSRAYSPTRRPRPVRIIAGEA